MSLALIWRAPVPRPFQNCIVLSAAGAFKTAVSELQSVQECCQGCSESEAREIGDELCRGLAVARGVVPAYLTLGVDQNQV